MNFFNVIEAAFFLIIIFFLEFVIKPISTFPLWLTYVLFALIGTVLHQLLIKAKTKWNWLNKKIDGQFGVFLIFLVFLSPLLIGFFVDFGK